MSSNQARVRFFTEIAKSKNGISLIINSLKETQGSLLKSEDLLEITLADAATIIDDYKSHGNNAERNLQLVDIQQRVSSIKNNIKELVSTIELFSTVLSENSIQNNRL